MALTLTTDERTELERRASSRTIRAEDAKRAKVILMLADGTSYSTIEATLWCYRDYINRWRRRFVAGRLDGLRSAHKGQKPSVLTPALEARILEQRPPDGSTHWSTDRPLPESATACGRVCGRREDGDSGPRSFGSGIAVVARPRRAPRLRVRPARHAVAGRRVEHPDRGSARSNRAAAHERGVRRASG